MFISSSASGIWLGLMGGLLMTSIALAQPQLSDSNGVMRSVQLRSGAVYRGELVELVPNDHIVLKLATGEVKRFDWADITPSDGTGQTAPATQAGTASGNAAVHIASNDPQATLEQETGTGTISNGAGYVAVVKLWEPVCRAPCDVALKRAGYFTIRGRGINPSNEFTLPPTGALTVRVDAGHRPARIASIVALILGGMGGLIPGVSMLAIGATQCSVLSCEVPAQKMRADAAAKNLFIGGGISLGLGLALGGLGTAGMILSRTRVTIEAD